MTLAVSQVCAFSARRENASNGRIATLRQFIGGEYHSAASVKTAAWFGRPRRRSLRAVRNWVLNQPETWYRCRMKFVSEPKCPSEECSKSFGRDGPLDLLFLVARLVPRPEWPKWF